MSTAKLTKRQEEVIRLLCAAPDRTLAYTRSNTMRIVEGADGEVSPRGVAPIVANALARAGLVRRDASSVRLAPTDEARAAFGPGGRQ